MLRGAYPRRALLAAAIFLAGAACGGALVHYSLFPYPELRWRAHQLSRSFSPAREGPRADLSLLTIRDSAEVESRRRELVRLIWGRETLPARLPDAVETGIEDRRFKSLPDLARIDRLHVRMDFGLDSKILHFVPARPNGALVLVHDGHSGPTGLNAVVARLLERGYAVAALTMPLFGDNARPAVRAGQLGRIVLDDHDKLLLVAPEAGLRQQYLLEPVPVALNHLLARSGYREAAMIGLSGGGWTTTLAAALDPRIAQSFPVAGSQPPDIVEGPAPADLEMNDPALYTRFSYLDLYLLGSAGAGRGQLQILNEFDPCCFAGRAALSYREAVADRARRLGGRFELLIDSSHQQHRISDWALERILAALDSWRGRGGQSAGLTPGNRAAEARARP